MRDKITNCAKWTVCKWTCFSLSPSKCWLSILRWLQINTLASFLFFLLNKFPFNQSCLLDSNTITCSGSSSVPWPKWSLFLLWIHKVFQLKQVWVSYKNQRWFKSAVEQLQDLITAFSYEQIVKENRSQEEELDGSIHLYLNQTHHSGDGSWMSWKLFSSFLGWP